MPGFFYNLGRMVGPKWRKANWLYRSLAGTEAESIRAEHGVGRDLAQAFAQQLESEPEPAVGELLEQLGGRLVSCLRQKEWRFRFIPVRGTEVNAFALPGGFIFVTRPLLELCRWDHDEIAFILGHEVGHVVSRHAIDRIMTNSFLSGVMSRLPVGGGLVRPHIAAVLNTLMQQGYSREQELEADKVGVQLARSAGFDTAAASRLLSRLGGDTGAGGSLFGYFASHPPVAERIRQVERLAG
jgi:predicted Zn-dependent protease